NPDEGEPQGLRDGPCFDVEVVEGLDVVRQEPDGRDHDSPRALLCGALELRAQVGPEPAPAAQALALVGDAHWMAERVLERPGARLELALIGIAGGDHA